MRRRDHSTKAFFWVFLAPFLLLSLIHPSVMPVRAVDGTLTMVLCSVDGPEEVTIDLATGAPVEKAPSDSPDHCDWACGQMTGACLALPGAAAPAARITRAGPPPAPVLLQIAAATGLPPATGPPSA